MRFVYLTVESPDSGKVPGSTLPKYDLVAVNPEMVESISPNFSRGACVMMSSGQRYEVQESARGIIALLTIGEAAS